MQLRTLRDVDVSRKRVLYRVGYDVPLRRSGKALRVADDTRLRETLPTLRFLRKHKARIVLLSWLGRPEGKRVPGLRMAPVARRLQALVGCKVSQTPDCVGPAVAKRIAALRPGEVLLLENVRFHPEEERNDPAFARALTQSIDLVVMDAFSQAHRAVASISGILQTKPSVAGFLLTQEVHELRHVLDRPARPLVAVIGGAKIASKLGLIQSLLAHVDYLLLGGALANTILKAKGVAVGKSLIEESMVRKIKRFDLTDVKLKIPIDVIVAQKKSVGAPRRRLAVGRVQPRDIILDIGPDTVELFGKVIDAGRTVIWNGPMGYYELAPFAAGTRAVARRIAASRSRSIAGGGETLDAIASLKLQKKFSFLSTGGGAMLAFLEGKPLPGIAPLFS